MKRLVAAVETGGTKTVCAIGGGPDDIVDQTVIPTTNPHDTLRDVLDFLRAARVRGISFHALGIASFGPLDLDPASPSHGHITTTTKPGWSHTDLAGTFRRALRVPVVIDTDVNGAAFGEYRWGAAHGTRTSAYLTVGTGIGGGAVIHGATLRGLLHPEMGHLHVRRHPADRLEGVCPFHGDCAEGLASGPAIRARTGLRAEDPGQRLDEVVALEAFYLSQLIAAMTYLLSPQIVVVGGGVAQLPGLFGPLRTATVARLGGALAAPALGEGIGHYLVPPALGNRSGVLGALAMALDLAEASPVPADRGPPAAHPDPDRQPT